MALAELVWLTFDDDTVSPHAIGLGIVDWKPGISIYQIAEWHTPADIRFSLWQFIREDGWRAFDSHANVIRFDKSP